MRRYTSDGTVKAYLNFSDTEDGALPKYIPAEKKAEAFADNYYDLDNAVIAKPLDSGKTLVSDIDATTTFANSRFANYVDADTGAYSGDAFTVILKQPDYTKGYVASTAKAVNLPAAGTDAETGKATGLVASFFVKNFDADSYDDMTNVELSAKVIAAGSGATTSETKYVGAVPAKTVTVKGKTPDGNLTFAIDDLKKSAGTPWSDYTYDGASHKIVNSTQPGVTIEYEMQDASNKWNSVSAVEFKNVGTYTARYKIYTEATKATATWVNKSFAVKAAGKVAAGFDKSSSFWRQNNYEIAGTDFDPWDFVEVTSAGGEYGANADAVKADKAALKEAFKTAYEITQTPDKYDANKITLVIKKKADYDADKFFKANKDLFANFVASGDPFNQDNALTTAVVATNVGEKDDDITFEGVTTKSYKAKKKTKKLAAKKTFTVVATADSGKDVTYSMTSSTSKITINKTTGKVTVKKGLKKGTYTLKIKAKTAAGKGYKAAKETITVKVKVK